MTSALENNHLAEYFQYVLREHSGPLPIKKAVLNTGCQANGTWVVNSTLFISDHGDELSSEATEESDLIWVNKDVFFENDKITSADISLTIKLPLTTDSLSDLIAACVNVGKHNLSPTC